MTDEYHSTVFKVPFVGHLLREFDKEIEEHGLHDAMRRAVSKSKTNLRVQTHHSDTIAILQHKAVVVVANHPYDSDVVALFASLPARQDSYLIINVQFVGICPSLDPHLIPVYIKHHRDKRNRLKLQGKFLSSLHPTPTYSPAEEHKRNRESIALASRKLINGNLVVIFPGRRSNTGRWFSGVGHMISQVPVLRDVYVIVSHIQGTGNRDYLRLIPGLRRILPPITVHLSAPLCMGNIINGNRDGKYITSVLEERYNRWVDSLPQ